MARQSAAQEINGFIKGIITEASPLTFPENASIDEVNFVLNKDGSRRRRLGIDFEEGYTNVITDTPFSNTVENNSYIWKSPGGFSEREFLVAQIGRTILIFDSSQLPVSQNLLLKTTIGTSDDIKMNFTTVDGILIVASGNPVINTFNFDGTNITSSTNRLLIRDLFGVTDIIGGVDLLEGSGVTVRPTTTTSAHTYNLRNQTFAIPRYYQYNEISSDPISRFFNEFGKFQSNSDNLVTFLYASPNDGDDRETKRYFGKDNFNNPLGTNRASIGYFIIDALSRGASRLSEISKLQAQYPQLQYSVSSLPGDLTPGGATVVSSYAGRAWFSGFSSQVIDGDNQSPRMTSYVLFSQLIQSPSDVYKCYQEGDPTSSDIPDLVDTDGGFLRLDGAFNIKAMLNVGDAIMVIAENGVWRITGGSNYGFSATNYLTSKITEHGCLAAGTVVLIDNTFMYWSDDGIYHVAPNQYGEWTATNITNNTIQRLFDEIPSTSKVNCQGEYDSYQRQVRWLYNNHFETTEPPKELVLDISLGAFYPTLINNPSVFPKPISIVRVPPFTTGTVNNFINDKLANQIISVSGDLVINTETSRVASTSELYYLTITGTSSNNLTISFSLYKDLRFKDWRSIDNVGIDASAFLLTGWTGYGDFQREKQIPYLTVYSLKTETGFDVEYNPINASSVKIQSQWNWTNDVSAGKWGTEFQAYRHKRFWTPSSTDSFDNGELVVVTRNKLRGIGRVLSLYIHTEPEKDCYLLGWSFLAQINGTV